MPIELSDYLVDTIAEAKRLLEVKADLGRIPIPKKHDAFKMRVEDLIDEWFRKEPIKAFKCPKGLTEIPPFEDDETLRLKVKAIQESEELRGGTEPEWLQTSFGDDTIPF